MPKSAEQQSFSKLSVKSQTVIPNDIRRYLGLKPGDTVRYRISDTGVLLEKAPSVVVEDPFVEFDEWSGAADEKAFAKF